ncbi:hypothetical protein [Geodermatophilus telluris]|uniref:hypothetical protein n=1 Tax=Geodermatophilus telluris TaxID=1190417 RepID=UPI000B89F8E6|nr:hypothetical protein [Geodermatophilus telluris]
MLSKDSLLRVGATKHIAMRREAMANSLKELLAAAPHQDKRQLLSALGQRGFTGVTTTDVKSVLYERRSCFASDGGTPPLWRLAASLAKTSTTAQPATGAFETLHS